MLIKVIIILPKMLKLETIVNSNKPIFILTMERICAAAANRDATKKNIIEISITTPEYFQEET